MDREVRVAILQAPGTNCDRETAFAFEYVGAKVDFVSIFSFIEGEYTLSSYHILCLPGGFTYGDDISAGRVLANQLRFLLEEEIRNFYNEGKPILGICNGFQVLVKSGILPYGPFSEESVSLVFNRCGHFIDRWLYLKVESAKSLWLKEMPGVVFLPIAHAEGRFVVKKEDISWDLQKNSQVVLQYCSPLGEVREEYNPNGSEKNIAGITDSSGRILGLMPHPERHFFKKQNPFWSSQREDGILGDGYRIFRNGVEYVKSTLL